MSTEIAPESWRCFHCDEVFTTREAAAEHFGNGDYEAEIPLCIQAATTEQKELILLNRDLWEQLRKTQNENDDLEFNMSGWEYTARKLTKKPSATTHDLEHEWDFMQGRVIAAEAAINAAPKWLRRFLRWRAERRGVKQIRKAQLVSSEFTSREERAA